MGLGGLAVFDAVAGARVGAARRRAVLHNRAVPRLSAFYGIVIYMYRPDHPPPHFHAQYGEHIAQVELGSLEVLHGHLPARALRLVLIWGSVCQAGVRNRACCGRVLVGCGPGSRGWLPLRDD
jgi:hypothetical protein